MFPWNIAKSSAEALSRYALKRVCKFVLKKKLGHFILGDIDIHQLDLQLADGLLHLSDLALNVDFINHKLSHSSSIFRVREGSIRSLFIKMPWNSQGCQVEIIDLELVLCLSQDAPLHHAAATPQRSATHHVPNPQHNFSAASLCVHEGVKTVAKLVNRLLTSFHLTIKNIIIAFDASAHKHVHNHASHDTLVFRLTQIQCGTSILEDTHPAPDAKTDSLLGMTHLTSFLNFQGAVIELVHINTDSASSSSTANSSKPLLTADGGGFSGTLNLSIPWNNGSLDIHKVDAQVSVDPFVAKLQPSTLKWILVTWEMFQNYDTRKADSIYYTAVDTLVSSAVLPDKKSPKSEYPIHFGTPSGEEMIPDVLLKKSSLISDWVPFSNEGFEEADLGASVDQFFECIDGMRSSHSTLGSSGVWNLTCSVVNAITAASNLASGSLNIPAEQQLVQTNLKITLVEVSAVFSFVDDDQLCQLGQSDEQVDAASNVHHLRFLGEGIVIAVQVYPQDWKLEATVKHIVLHDYLSQRGDLAELCLHDHVKSYGGMTRMIQDMQDKVQSALPFSSVFAEALNVNDCGTCKWSDTPSSLSGPDTYACSSIVKATLFETSGASHCVFAVSSGSSDRYSTGRVSFSLNVSPLTLWLSFDLVNMILNLSRELGDFMGKSKAGAYYSSETREEKPESSSRSHMSWRSDNHSTSAPRRGGLVGNIFVPHARVILCFPSNEDRGVGGYTSWNQFIALEFSSLDSEKLKPERSTRGLEDTYWKKDSPSPPHAVHLNIANLDVYHITNAVGDDCSAELASKRFCAQRILSLGNGTGWVRLVSMLWHENAVTGPWIVKSAKLFATSDGPTTMSSTSSGFEFASVSTREDSEDHSSLKQKLVMSSKFCLHVCAPSMVVILCRSRYLCLFDLFNQALEALSIVGHDTDCENREGTVSQTCVLLECGLVEIQMKLDDGDAPKSSLQRELPGSWHRLRLEVQNLQLLSVSELGDVSGANFLWMSHCEGKLWGSVEVADQYFLLISCSNSSNGRGDGEGSNVLSCRPAGSDILRMCDPETSHDFISVNFNCGTIVAPGGRLDWLDKISSFFSLPSSGVDQEASSNLQKGGSQRLSFVLKFIDGALCYEPYFGKAEVEEECLSSKSHVFVSLDENPCEPSVACLLCASSLTVSHTTMAGNLDDDYSIRFLDVGFLLRAASKDEIVLGEYNVHSLRELGSVKVAGEALVDATLRINYKDDITWELNFSGSPIVLRTCHDTTLGLIHLASQIQELFAPDMEESLVHLQNRWNSLQQEQGRDYSKGVSETSSTCYLGTSQAQQLVPDSEYKRGLVSLMGDISDDAFLLSEKSESPCVRSQLVYTARNDEGPSTTGSCSEHLVEGGQTPILQKTKINEGYWISDLRSLSELTINSHFQEEISKSNFLNGPNMNLQKGNTGWYSRTSVQIVDNYVTERNDKMGSRQFIEGRRHKTDCRGSRRCKGRLLVKNIEVKWLMCGGSDWHKLGQYGDIFGRDGTVCLELVLSNMNIQHDIFPDGDICASKLCVSVQDFHLYDQSKNAPWKLVLGYYSSKERPRESFSKAFKLELDAVRPDPTTPLEEYRLRIAILPMLLYLHQSQLDFLVAFFGGKSSPVEQQGDPQDSGSSDLSSCRDNKLKGIGIAEEALLPFFQKFDIWPTVVRVDYRPSRVDLAALSGGKYVELVNLVPWKGIELKLKHVQAAGVYGWANVCETIVGDWLEDISQNQIHKLLQGLPTISSFVAVGSGAAKLVSLPVKSYRKDSRLVKGLQRGTIAFLRSISVEALGLGVHLAAGAHDILLHAECILTRIQPSVPRPSKRKLKINVGSDQPQDAQHGFQQAYESLSDGFGKTASTLIRTPMKAYQRGGSAGSAIATAVRGAPAAAIAPASAAAQALHCALVGVRNSLDPERKEESMNKYLGQSHSCKRN